jgi:hypothetical protein
MPCRREACWAGIAVSVLSFAEPPASAPVASGGAEFVEEFAPTLDAESLDFPLGLALSGMPESPLCPEVSWLFASQPDANAIGKARPRDNRWAEHGANICLTILTTFEVTSCRASSTRGRALLAYAASIAARRFGSHVQPGADMLVQDGSANRAPLAGLFTGLCNKNGLTAGILRESCSKSNSRASTDGPASKTECFQDQRCGLHCHASNLRPPSFRPLCPVVNRG